MLLIQGNCLDVMKKLKNQSVDMVFCDLPFGTTQCKWDIVIPFKEMWEEINRVTKPNGAILLFGNNPFSSQLITSNLTMYRYDWIIEKTHATGHLNAKKMPMKAHEYIHVFYKNPTTYNPQKNIWAQKKNIHKKK